MYALLTVPRGSFPAASEKDEDLTPVFGIVIRPPRPQPATSPARPLRPLA